MFTGLIEEIGTINKISQNGSGLRLTVRANQTVQDLKVDDSVSINGVCQTVVKINNNIFEVEAVEETLLKTTFKYFKLNEQVNLERAVLSTTRLGGHFVQGHIDCIGIVKKIEILSSSTNIWVRFPIEFATLLVPTGSICINGVSLTSARVENDLFMVAIIPHTIKSTNLKDLKIDSKVNLEFDIIGKYINRILNMKENPKSNLEKYITQPMD